MEHAMGLESQLMFILLLLPPEMFSSPLLCPHAWFPSPYTSIPKLLPLSAPGKGLGTILRGSGLGTHSILVPHQQHRGMCARWPTRAALSPWTLVLPSRYSVCCDWSLKIPGGHTSAMSWGRRPWLAPTSHTQQPLARLWYGNSTLTEVKLSILRAQANEDAYGGTGLALDTISTPLPEYTFSQL